MLLPYRGTRDEGVAPESPVREGVVTYLFQKQLFAEPLRDEFSVSWIQWVAEGREEGFSEPHQVLYATFPISRQIETYSGFRSFFTHSFVLWLAHCIQPRQTNVLERQIPKVFTSDRAFEWCGVEYSEAGLFTGAKDEGRRKES